MELAKENLSASQIICLLKMFSDLLMPLADVTNLAEALNLEILPKLKVEKYIICLVETWKQTVSITEQHSIHLENFNKILCMKILSPGIKRLEMQIIQN
jgi:hypothetical protein